MTAFGGQFPCPLGMRDSELQSRAHRPTKTFLHGFQVQVSMYFAPTMCWDYFWIQIFENMAVSGTQFVFTFRCGRSLKWELFWMKHIPKVSICSLRAPVKGSLAHQNFFRMGSRFRYVLCGHSYFYVLPKFSWDIWKHLKT